MVRERDGLLGRLRGAIRPTVVAPEKEYIRHTPEERRELLARTFGIVDETEEEDALDDAVPAEGTR
jgi:hypothetical protein